MRITSFRPTPDDWYSNFKIHADKRYTDTKLVCLSLLSLSDGQYRVCVWGNDDTGMEFDTPNLTYARRLYTDLCLQPEITKRDLVILGFPYA